MAKLSDFHLPPAGTLKLAAFFAIAAIVFALAYAYFQDSSVSYGSAKVMLPDGKAIDCEVPLTGAGKELGLMHRKTLCESCGMLFIFDREGKLSFWMKNMEMNIDMVFINKDWKVVGIAQDVEPCLKEPCTIYSPNFPAQYVLELNANATREHGIFVGSEIRRIS
jgi:uncharacterized protein